MNLFDYIEPPLTEAEKQFLAKQRASFYLSKKLGALKAKKSKRSPSDQQFRDAIRETGLTRERFEEQAAIQRQNGIKNFRYL